ncbi:hypothetical protein BC827DRAFT_1196301 [Russula dissimulans]|nr:hypothetical protein BC827DRAFT_1196301 [Russula dissimulans]
MTSNRITSASIRWKSSLCSFTANSGTQRLSRRSLSERYSSPGTRRARQCEENSAHREAIGLPPLVEERVMPGIDMVGTSPAFFKIPVTQTLSTHIRHGTYPPEESRVTYFYPTVPRPARRHDEGMKPLTNQA